jgi:hypothetical protein
MRAVISVSVFWLVWAVVIGQPTLAAMVSARSDALSSPCEVSLSADGSQKSMGFYVWKTEPFLTASSEDERFWQPYLAYGANQLLLSFTMRQIDVLTKPAAIQRMTALIKAANAKGLRIDLLLAEPTWILPEHRYKLKNIISRLSTIPFAGVNLNLEPNQLEEEGYTLDYLLPALANTLAEAVAVSPWPVALSTHFRYLNKPVTNGNFATLLERTGVHEVTLLVFMANTTNAMASVAPIIATHPKLRFSIALSVEDPNDVAEVVKQESLFSMGLAGFLTSIHALQTGLIYANLTGIVLQDWRNYQTLHKNTCDW